MHRKPTASSIHTGCVPLRITRLKSHKAILGVYAQSTIMTQSDTQCTQSWWLPPLTPGVYHWGWRHETAITQSDTQCTQSWWLLPLTPGVYHWGWHHETAITQSDTQCTQSQRPPPLTQGVHHWRLHHKTAMTQSSTQCTQSWWSLQATGWGTSWDCSQTKSYPSLISKMAKKKKIYIFLNNNIKTEKQKLYTATGTSPWYTLSVYHTSYLNYCPNVRGFWVCFCCLLAIKKIVGCLPTDSKCWQTICISDIFYLLLNFSLPWQTQHK